MRPVLIGPRAHGHALGAAGLSAAASASASSRGGFPPRRSRKCLRRHDLWLWRPYVSQVQSGLSMRGPAGLPTIGLPFVLLLAACGPTVVPQPALPSPVPGIAPPIAHQQMRGVMGADARGLQRLFGEPRLDIRDPAARKLQFANDQCVLDAYLYPPAANREPVVTHVDARTRSGEAVDWNACAAVMRRR